MAERGDPRQATARVLDREEPDGAMTGFYGGQSSPPQSGPAPKPEAETNKRDGKPSHYKVICISMYTEDLKRLDRMVEELKSRGLTKANRSALIRYALGEVDLDRVPKGL